ncbi:MAG: adenylyltransferase/cytidyltransferase family protein [Promethearchaeota archaeon]
MAKALFSAESAQRKRVLCFGTFDILHYGHVKYFEEAKKLGGDNAELIVVVARDSSVETMKGKKPIFSEEHRRALVASIKPVDVAILGTEGGDKLKIFEEIRPDIVALGYDQWPSITWLKEELKERNIECEIVRLSKFGSEELNSSSLIVKKILKLRKDWAENSS